MWKIVKVKFKNFIHLYSGMGKYEVNLDLSDSMNKINVLVGKMGSGKSSILGHLQPFATLGTLDNRNQDGIIIKDKDGLKEIVFINDGREIIVRHEYIWNKNSQSHNIRSYIMINGEECNTNGNVSSFKEIVKNEFGIEQNFLRLLRLGPMVSNIINMKATERKTFIASLINDTEIYNLLYKKMSDDLRKLNSHIKILSSKLVSLDASKEDIFNANISRIKEDMSSLELEITNTSNEISHCNGMNSVLVSSYGSLDRMIDHSHALINKNNELRDSIGTNERLLSTTEEYSIKELSTKVGELLNEKKSIIEKINKLNDDNKNYRIDIAKLEDYINLQNNSHDLEYLIESCKDVEKRYLKYKGLYDESLSNKYSYKSLSEFINNLPMTISTIEELSQYSYEELMTIKNRQGIGTWCSKKIEMLNGKKYNLQKNISNIKFSDTYTPTIIPVTPLFCPTDNCPYKVTHPYTIKEKSFKSNIDNQLLLLMSEIDSIDAEISLYEEYPRIQKHFHLLNEQWKNISRTLMDLDCISNSSLFDILTVFQYRKNWYNHTKLISVLEKYKVKEEYDEVSTQYFTMKDEINNLKDSSVDNSIEKLNELKRIVSHNDTELDKLSILFDDVSSGLRKSEELLITISEHDVIRNRISNEKEMLEYSESELNNISSNIRDIETNNNKIRDLTQSLNILKLNYSGMSKSYEELLMRLRDIEYTKSEYGLLYEEQSDIKNILLAISPKSGIPLIMVKKFLDSSRENINDLIRDVFEDDLEIVDFSINIETGEFMIPYLINGTLAEDISMASQGQQSIISIALSFALIRESCIDYNIMLLDEVDGPLYKKDRDRFLTLLYRQMSEINSDQVFFCSHNNTFEGNPTNVLLTTPENIDKTYNREYRLY